MHFSRLRLSGFKSFVDPTEFVIEKGLTGVVGPNGCGKSNLLEALRWVMGEASAKKMRGGGMDDVIFSGTEMRPGRNVAEVTVTLDNSERNALAAWNDNDEVQIVRRIERGGGSSYRINGQETRARDVQLFFADIATGTRSSALVSQGQIADLIHSRPQARRHLLEEAAGIAGLQSRRHEAELRLRAAETNLERLGDVIGGLETRFANLQRQARQAQRYRRLSDRIRDAEARWLLRRWQDAEGAVATSTEALLAIESEVVEATRQVAEATTAQATAAEALPPLREAEGQASAALNELTVARVALEAEERRINEQRREIVARLDQFTTDLERETTLAEDARRALSTLDDEERDLLAQREAEAEAVAGARAACDDMQSVVSDLEKRVTRLAEERAARAAQRRALEARITDLEGRLARLDRQASDIEAEHGQLNLGLDETDSLDRLCREEGQAQTALDTARDALVAATEALEARRTDEETSRARFRDADARHVGLKAERDALASLLERGIRDGAPVIDSIRVAEGFETALGVALGDDLDSPVGPDGATGWTMLPPYADAPLLPDRAEPLANHVAAPGELARRLSQVGVVDDMDGPELARRLRPGQCLVTRSGRLWRWDGFVINDSETGAAALLAQRRRLEELGRELSDAERQRGAAESALTEAAEAAVEASRAAQSARDTADEHAEALAHARENRRSQEARSQAAESRRRDLTAMSERIAAERGELATALGEVRSERDALPQNDGDDGLEALRDELTGKRSELSRRQTEHDRLYREAEFRERRVSAIAVERQSWQERASGADTRIADLDQRLDSGRQAAADLEDKPKRIAAQRRDLADRLSDAENALRQASDVRAAAEETLAERARGLRRAEAGMSDRREERARREGVVEQARQAGTEIARQIQERLETAPDGLKDRVADHDTLPDAGELEAKFARVVRERENMGPVNLRAEIEAQEVDEQLSVMLSEREDLEAAIARLRRGIGELNREGRERLLIAFQEIDGHFQRLHKRLFGGHARLTMVDSDDPLEAGLEIEASPSGKKMQSLSLLSGGEQALTAMALIFALFLTNPSPVCVLDEVDAPLDDSNVDRFCDLLDEFANSGNTRFLIITHHRLTMARMDRLFGVTMSEPGVSRLVSVDLAAAEQLRAIA
ncbi:MAG: AAA family ATPase [Rhodospirillales bacterium]|nr:AAA family ATPase [Rhodospirillales bacterium]